MGAPQQALLAVSSGDALADIDAAWFDGTNDYMRYQYGLHDAANSQQGLLSFWIAAKPLPDSLTYILHTGSASGNALQFRVFVQSDGTVTVTGQNTSQSQVLGFGMTTPIGTSASGRKWNHVLISWDTSASPAELHMYLNDEDAADTTPQLDDEAVDYSQFPSARWWAVGAQANGSPPPGRFGGGLADIWFDPAQYLDLSVEDNRRLFVSEDIRPIDLGADGSTPTGTPPLLFFSLASGADVSTFGINRASTVSPSEDFTITGALETGSSPVGPEIQIQLVPGTTSWVVPDDWNSSNNEIHCIGGGASGARQNGAIGGGGGGAWARTDNLTLTPGSTVDVSIGAGGAIPGGAQDGNDGGDTWLSNTGSPTEVPTSTSEGCLAKGGSGNSGATGGAGGASGSCVGDAANSGGAGGTASANKASGGGAGGPNGIGGAGGAANTDGGGGGGGGGGGEAGDAASASANGGDGGGNFGSPSYGGGDGAINASNEAVAGTDGGGGGGGANGSGPYQTGAPGGDGIEWEVVGSGGGGGGADTSEENFGWGGNFGGGAGSASSSTPPGQGADGIIVIIYTPA